LLVPKKTKKQGSHVGKMEGKKQNGKYFPQVSRPRPIKTTKRLAGKKRKTDEKKNPRAKKSDTKLNPMGGQGPDPHLET